VVPIDKALPIRMKTTANEHLVALKPEPTVRNPIEGLSAGTALATVLRDAGLGFRPVRTPAGTIDLMIEPLKDIEDPWPVGWELPPMTPQSNAAPKLYDFEELGFDEASVQDVLTAAGAAIEVPMLVDYHALSEAEINLDIIKVSYPLKKTTWSLMLNTVIRKAKLTKVVMTDESGKPFVSITQFMPERLKQVQ